MGSVAANKSNRARTAASCTWPRSSKWRWRRRGLWLIPKNDTCPKSPHMMQNHFWRGPQSRQGLHCCCGGSEISHKKGTKNTKGSFCEFCAFCGQLAGVESPYAEHSVCFIAIHDLGEGRPRELRGRSSERSAPRTSYGGATDRNPGSGSRRVAPDARLIPPCRQQFKSRSRFSGTGLCCCSISCWDCA